MLTDEDLDRTLELAAPGSAIGRYTIGSVIGSGGMGVVYLARDSELEREVALKFLSRDLSQDPDWRSRFRREAQAIAKLNHPNIVTIYEVGEHNGWPFIAMEHVKGESIDSYVSTQRPSVEGVLELAMQISDGLTEAHNHSIVHCDIKPTNILINDRGRVKIVDFGLALLLDRAPALPKTRVSGTAPYISPEQIQGLGVDERSDLFSLGVVLYEILTGKTPFAGKNLMETLNAIVSKELLPITEYSAGVPLELERIVFRLLAKKPDQRYQRAADLGADLRYALEAVISGRVQYPGRKKDYSRSIAVLPFSNISSNSEEEYFCDGIAEEIINALAQAKGLRVAARTSTLAFRESKEDIREIGRKLHVETLLEGSVRRAGNRLRVTVQLIDVTTGYHLWSERYDQEAEEIFAIQDAIAQNVFRALQLILSDDEQQAITRSTTADSNAYDYYLRGRQFFHQRRRKSLQFATQMFVRAAEIDPKYALAYVGVADCCSMLVHFYGESGNIHLAEADRASSRALELDAELAQAHAARGFTLWLMNRFDEAKVEFETALKMDKNQAETWYLYGRACFQRGEIAEAAKLFEEACQGHEHHEARYFAAQAHSALGNTETANALYRLAFRAIEKHVELNPDDARAFTTGAVSLCRLGESEAGLAWARRAVAIDPEDAGIQYNVACLHALEGDSTRAIQCLEAAVKAGFAHRDWVERDPDLDSLRDDPRFKTLKWRE